MSFVLDNSVAMTWCFEDEATAPTDILLNRVIETGAFTTQFWPLEATNVLLMAQARQRIDSARRLKKMLFLHQLPITPDEYTYDAAWATVADLADRFHLTSYDAAYLELALRLQLPLATLDADLRAAAGKAGVEVLGR